MRPAVAHADEKRTQTDRSNYHQVGRLWISLGDHFIRTGTRGLDLPAQSRGLRFARLGQFEKARDIYEEAMATVSTVCPGTIFFSRVPNRGQTCLSGMRPRCKQTFYFLS